MQRYSEILRFQEGKLSQHPTPGAAIVMPPPGTPVHAGEEFAVLVDLTPQLPHRSREIRVLAASTYWSSTGGIVARLRRALAEANRHLIHANVDAEPGTKCSGSITCVVFSEGEAFFGQIGAAYAFVRHPWDRVEIFPPRDRLLIPLGGSLPPVIHIGYTEMQVGSTVLLATTPAIESHARERWHASLIAAEPQQITENITQAMAESQASGSFVLLRAQPEPAIQPALEPEPHRGLWLFRGRATPASQPAPAHPAIAEAITGVPPASEPPVPTTPTLPPAVKARVDTTPEPETARPSVPIPAFLQRRAEPELDAATAAVETPRPSIALPKIKLPSPRALLGGRSRDKHTARYRERRTTAQRARLRRALRTLLPGKVKGDRPRQTASVPKEKTSVTGGLTLGLILVTFFITMTMYMQYGGQASVETWLAKAESQRTQAFNSQTTEDWRKLLDISSQVITLDPQNATAAAYKREAQAAIDAKEKSAVLDGRQLLDLGVAPTPRRLLVAGSWIYILNTAADEVSGIPFKDDGITPISEVPVPILKRGQTLHGQVVDHLVDLAWVEPGGNYPDGAVFIYSDGGMLYIYEPALGPAGITRQRLQGNLGPGTVTLIDTFGEKLYLVHRQENQILAFEPINGIYDTSRNYFAMGVAPYLQEVLDIGVDGRVYLLMGDGTIKTYWGGSEDRSFQISNLPDTNVHSLVLAIESDPETGLVYMGDPQRARIVVLDKRGEFTHQFRLASDELRQLEAIAVSESPHVLYLVAANRLYAAPLPDFVAH